MGFFSGKEPKPFKSNNMLVEVLDASRAREEGVCETGFKAIEKMIERRYLYRNVESVDFEKSVALVKYKDLKVRSEFEVKKMVEEMRKEAGLDLGR